MWWHMPVIPALRGVKQEARKIEESLGDIQRPCLENCNSGSRGSQLFRNHWNILAASQDCMGQAQPSRVGVPRLG